MVDIGKLRSTGCYGRLGPFQPQGGLFVTRATTDTSTRIGVTLPRLDGGDLNLAETGGKQTLLFMWASW